jgi:hypothetical protein
MALQVHRRIVAAALLALAAAVAVAPHAALAQLDFELVAKDDPQRRLVETIRDAQSRDGPFSPELIEPLTTLAVLYRESGEHALAAAAIDRALQLLRANEGLYTLDQLPLLQQSIENDETHGDLLGVEDVESKLKSLVARHPNDLRIVPVLRDFGDRQMNELRRLRAGELPVPALINARPPIGDEEPFTSRSARAEWMARQAWRYYSTAVGVLVRHGAYTSDELRELEMQLVRLSHVHFKSYDAGRRSLLRQVSYDVARQDPLVDRVKALIRVADWDLLYTHHGLAVDTYVETYELLKKYDVPADAIDEIFSPEVPVVLPTFLPNPLETSEAGSAGHVDVRFDVHMYGGARNVEIVGATPNATRADRESLERMIRTSKFRPRIADGALGRSSPVALRYFLHSPPASDASESTY